VAIDDEIARLRLRHAGDPEAARRILQAECRAKAARKLPDTLRCGEFVFPTALSAEQCTSDEIAEFHAGLVAPGARVLDMTCGLGIDAFHMARRAGSVTAIELDPGVASAATANARALGLGNVEVLCSDSAEWLSADSRRRFDVIFIDPARRGAGGRRLRALAECAPDVTALLPLLGERCSTLIVKASPMLDLTQLGRELPGATDIYAVGTRRECKETVVMVRFGGDSVRPQEPTVHAVTVGEPEFSFVMSDERKAGPRIAPAVEPGMTLYEPWPAVMKAAPFNLLPLPRLHRDTHLYVSPEPVAEFPGAAYRVGRVEPFSSSALKRLARERPAASVATRNFPLTAGELRSRLHAGESATVRLMGATAATGRLLLFLNSESTGL